jgi:glycosyltransferase involved in cell wall biosynthesis
MNVLFLMIAYPDIAENSSMYTDLAQEFVNKGHDVYVAVASGHDKTSFKVEGSPKVLRVRTLELFNTSLIKKGIANILLPYQVIKGIKKYLHGVDFDAVIVSTPPITYRSTVKKLKVKFRSKVYLILRDIFPQNAVDLGILKNPVLINYFRKEEKDLYAIADYIGCMSPGNIAYLKNHNPEVNENKIHLLPNWKNVTEFSQPDFNIKRELGLENKFIALYGGNMGKPQNIDFILELAKENMHRDNVVFLLLGDGSEKRRITDLVAKNRLLNVVIKERLPQRQYKELTKVCDIGLVNLSEKFSIPNIPSRILSYWEARLPVLAATDRNTDLRNIIEQSGSGLWCISGDMDSYKLNFDKLYQNNELRREMGEKGHKYLLENCTTEKAFSIINEKLMA